MKRGTLCRAGSGGKATTPAAVIRTLCALIAGLAAAAALLVVTGGSAASARTAAVTRYVAPGADCGGMDPCYATIQAAIDAVTPGEPDLILVAQGTYTGVASRGGATQLVYVDEPVWIQGGYLTGTWAGPDPATYGTVLDAEGQGRVLSVAAGVTPTLEGLWLINGNADRGGGISADGAWPTIRRCWVVSNTATFDGGGIYIWQGGATIEKSTILANRANSVTGSGGGLAIFFSSALLDGNLIEGNDARASGGGLWLEATSEHTIRLTNNAFVDNHASDKGAAIYVAGGYPQFLHTTLVGNKYTTLNAVYIDHGLVVGRPGSASFTNTVMADQVVGVKVTTGNTVTLRGVLWYATYVKVDSDAGAVALLQDEWTGNPDFTTDGYHLGVRSAAIDRGLSAGVVTDIDGQTRPIGPASDLGADEAIWQWWTFLPAVLRRPS